ncbi:hypothetical protein Tsubulata_030821, partial [Turnera subulata]
EPALKFFVLARSNIYLDSQDLCMSMDNRQREEDEDEE